MSNSPVYGRIHVWVGGEVLFAADLNAEFNNIITNTIPQDLGAYSGTVNQMQSVVSPGGVGSESLATNLSGELERIRYTIKELKTFFKSTISQWYQAISGAIDATLTLSGVITFSQTPVFPNAGLVPTGTLLPFAGAEGSVPSGFLVCYGQAVSRATYAALFSLISTTYGVGDGVNTFNLPDLRGRFPLGKDDMGGVAASRVAAATSLAQAAGEEKHTLTINEMPAHTHTALVGGGGSVDYSSGNVESPGNTGSTGGGVAHNNMNPYLTINYIIRI